MDSKTLNYVRSKYFQTISPNDTLQTFFQLSSGKIPSCTTVSKFVNLIFKIYNNNILLRNLNLGMFVN